MLDPFKQLQNACRKFGATISAEGERCSVVFEDGTQRSITHAALRNAHDQKLLSVVLRSLKQGIL